jgi:glycopeptide antibiotics resistance protein
VFLARRRRGKTINYRELINFYPFRSKLAFWTHRPTWNTKAMHAFYSDLLGNIFLFIPFAFAIIWMFPKKRWTFFSLFFIVIGTSTAIECFQYIFNIGVADIDDLLLNTAGGLLGIALYNLLSPLTTGCR